MHDYKCEKCNRRVAVVDGKIVRSCGHEDAKVVSDMSATVVSESTLTEKHKRAS